MQWIRITNLGKKEGGKIYIATTEQEYLMT